MGAPLQQRLMDEMKSAMREGDTLRLSVIRMLRAATKNKEIEKGRDNPLTEADIISTIASAAKQRKDSIEQFTKGGRQDLAEKEEKELKILETFLPPPLSLDEVKAKVLAVIQEEGAQGPRDMGKVMKKLMPELGGRIDGSEVSRLVQELLRRPS